MTVYKVIARKDGKPNYKESLTTSTSGSALQVSGVWVSKSSLRDLKGQPLRLPVPERVSLEERMARNVFAAAASKRSAATQKPNKLPNKKGEGPAAAPNTARGTRASKAAAAAAPADGASAASGSAAAASRSAAVI